MTHSMTPWRWILLTVSLLLLIWSLMPVIFDGMFGVGVAVPLAAALLGVFGSVYRPKSDKQTRKGWRKAMGIAGIVLAALIVVVGSVCTVLMVQAAHRAPAEGATVVVLGSKIHSDRPSRMLGDRLRVAAAYLREHPTANCVVSGGLGKGETYTEAYVMKKYLVEVEGIAPARIQREDESTDTRENLLFSMEIIRQQGWSTHVVTATQIFHQYRAGRLAMEAGAASVGSAACHTPFHLMLNYWVRECAAICRLWIAGY